MYQRPFILFLCLLIILSSLFLSGCSFIKEDKNVSESEKWQGVIVLWDFPRWPDKNGDRFGWIEEKITQFEKSHPGVFIQLRRLKWEYGMIELRAAAASGTHPDIAPVASDLGFIAGGYLESVKEFFTPEELKEYEPKALEAVSYNGEIYGFPWFITTYGLFLNKDVFSARNAQVPEKGTWTYDEFVQALQKVSYDKNHDGKNDYFGFNVFLSPGSYQIWPFLTMDGANIFDDKGNFVLNSPEGILALTRMVDLEAKYKVTPEEYGTLAEKEVWGDFVEKNKIAVYPAGPWAIKILSDLKKEGKGFDFEIAHYPKGDSFPTGISLVSGYGIFRQEDQQKKAMCIEFLKYITSEKEQEALIDYGVFPAMTKVSNRVIKDPHMLKMKEILDTSAVLPKIKNWHTVDEIITTQIRQALISKKTPAEALEDAQEEIQKIKEMR